MVYNAILYKSDLATMKIWYFMIVLGVAVIDGDHVQDQPINVAVLLPIVDDSRPFSAVKLRPAVDLAVDHVSTILPGHLQISYRDSNCSEVHGINEAINYFVRGPPHVYFGPICDYAVAPVARQTYFWNIPVVSVGAVALDFLLKRHVNYPLLTRAGPVNLVGLTNAILAAMSEHGWRRVKLLYEREAGSDVIPPFCHLTSQAIYYLLESTSSDRVVRRDYYKFDPDPTTINFDEVLVNEVGYEFAGKWPNGGYNLIRSTAMAYWRYVVVIAHYVCRHTESQNRVEKTLLLSASKLE